MKILGMDFTSVPSRTKPITLAECEYDGQMLNISALSRLDSFKAFEDTLISAGPWVAGIDFPFGQSRRFVENVRWPLDWAQYVELVAKLSRKEFREVLENYKRDRPAGDREHCRDIDALCGGQSPQKLYGVPVALMFFEGASRLLRCGASIVPVRPNGDSRVVIEAYPAVVARFLVGRAKYKPDPRKKQLQSAARNSRIEMVRGVADSAFERQYGFKVLVKSDVAEHCINDITGDSIDAVLAAIQAGWAQRQRTEGFGVPQDVDQSEGWIPDPMTREN